MRSDRLRVNGGHIRPQAFQARKEYFVAKDTGALHEQVGKGRGEQRRGPTPCSVNRSVELLCAEIKIGARAKDRPHHPEPGFMHNDRTCLAP